MTPLQVENIRKKYSEDQGKNDRAKETHKDNWLGKQQLELIGYEMNENRRVQDTFKGNAGN